jgi:molybdenum cofactor guanylyltransferase
MVGTPWVGYFGSSPTTVDAEQSSLQSLALWMFFVKKKFVYDRAMNGLSAFVLAGGQSSRMGSDKAFVELEGRSLLSRMLGLASSVTAEVCIVGDKAKFGGEGRVIEDEFPNHGPLGGIHAALLSSESDLNLILAVDMPFVEVQFLQYLSQQAAANQGAVVTLARENGNWQPLCAVYRKAFLRWADEALRQGKNKIDPLFSKLELRVIEEKELVEQNFPPSMFRNLNTPEELQQASKG